MKKSVIIGIVIAVILVVIVGAVIIVNLVNKEIIGKNDTIETAIDFKSSMENKGYTIMDVTSQFANNEDIKQAYIATNNDYSYRVEFYEIENDDYAKVFYNNNKANFVSSKKDSDEETYILSTESKYKVVCRKRNTVIFINADNKYKDTTNDILKELGY